MERQALATGEETTTSFTRATSGLIGCNPRRNEPASAFQQSRGRLQKCRIEVVLLMSRDENGTDIFRPY
jgi:hypothetical protein